MKKLLLFPLCLIACFCFAQNTKEIIGNPIKIGNMLVAQNDFPKELNWNDANKACKALGKGWRLPTKTELNLLYENKEKIGGFSNNTYWSATGDDYQKSILWFQSFGYGDQQRYSGGESTLSVRAINAPPAILASRASLSKKIIGKPVKIGRLLVAQNDFPEPMNWNDAKAACASLGSGWRLPTTKELNIIHNYVEKIGETSFLSNTYWSSQLFQSYEAWYKFFPNNEWETTYKDQDLGVRAVKAL
jgi:hypothetical protein